MEAALLQIGLRFNLRKTQLFAADATLCQGKLRDIHPEHVLAKISWSSETSYLRKPLRHLKVGESTYTVLAPYMRKAACHGFASMKPVLTGLRWGEPDLAVHLVNKYMGSRWFWMAPLMIPSMNHVQELLVLQVTLLLAVLHLFVPASVKDEVAHALQRVRRRIVHLLLAHKIQCAWPTIWRLGFWGYVGHLFRKPETHVTRRILLSFEYKSRPQGGSQTLP